MREEYVDVWVNGIKLVRNTEYSSNGKHITITSPEIIAGDDIEIITWEVSLTFINAPESLWTSTTSINDFWISDGNTYDFHPIDVDVRGVMSDGSHQVVQYISTSYVSDGGSGSPTLSYDEETGTLTLVGDWGIDGRVIITYDDGDTVLTTEIDVYQGGT